MGGRGSWWYGATPSAAHVWMQNEDFCAFNAGKERANDSHVTALVPCLEVASIKLQHLANPRSVSSPEGLHRYLADVWEPNECPTVDTKHPA